MRLWTATRTRLERSQAVLAGALTAIVAATTLAIAAPAHAQDSGAPIRLAQLSAERTFDIAAQPLTTALTLFGQQSGLQVTVHGTLPRDMSAPQVRGTMTSEEALIRLLVGSGLTYVVTDETTVAIERPGAEPKNGPARLGTIRVGAVREGEVTDSYAAPRNFAATRTDTPVIDTPQSTQAVTRQALEDAGATTVADAYDYLAGISATDTTGGFGNEYLARGFETDNILINGNRGGRPAALDTANVERVEAIRGPTATLFGRADPGGLVNVVTKQPLAEPFYEADLQGGAGFFGNGSRYRDVRATLDAGGPIDERGRARYRFNMAAEHERSFRQDIEDTLFFVSPVVDVDLDDKTIASLELTYQYRDTVFDQGVPVIDGEPELPVDYWFGEGQAPGIDLNYFSGTFRVDREFSEALTGRFGVFSSYNDFKGDTLQAFSISDTQGEARRFSGDVSAFIVTAQPELVAEFETGPVGHTLLFGADASYRTTDATTGVGVLGAPFDFSGTNFPVDIPDVDPSRLGSISTVKNTARELGFYVQNQVDLSEQWKVLAGLRWDAVWLDVEREVPSLLQETENFHDTAILPRLGLVYQPVEEIGFYASYSETYRPPVALRTRLASPVPDPEEGRNYEVGIKLDALDGRLVGTLAAFRSVKENVLRGDPSNPRVIINLGEVRSQGIEFDLSGEIFENFNLGATYAFTDAQVNSDENPNLPKGTRFRNVPRHTASLQAAYRFTEGMLDGLRLFGGLVYEADKKAFASATDDTELPDYVRFDLGASYDFTDNIQARLFLQNVTDQEYYTASQGFAFLPGQPFNATLGIRVRF